MEMSIEEAIIQSRIQLTIWEEECTSKLNNSPKAIETLIEIAKKYPKIKEQVDIAIDKENFAISNARLIQIREIINENDV